MLYFALFVHEADMNYEARMQARIHIVYICPFTRQSLIVNSLGEYFIKFQRFLKLLSTLYKSLLAYVKAILSSEFKYLTITKLYTHSLIEKLYIIKSEVCVHTTIRVSTARPFH